MDLILFVDRGTPVILPLMLIPLPGEESQQPSHEELDQPFVDYYLRPGVFINGLIKGTSHS